VISRGVAASIGALDRQVAWPRPLDGEPGMSRNGGYDRYRGRLGRECLARARRPKYCKLATIPATTGSSGEAQIGLVARADSPVAEENASWKTGVIKVSHETIYRSLFVQKRGVLRRAASSSSSKRSMRRSKQLIRMAIDGGISRISSQSVSDAAVEDRQCLAIGRRSAVRAEQQLHRTLVERHTRYVMLAKVEVRTPRR